MGRTLCQSMQIQNRQPDERGIRIGQQSWSEIDHIQSLNGINQIDFYKAILLVQGQPIESIIDTGSPVMIISPKNIPLELRKTTKSYVDVNKNPIKFKGEVSVEVKTEKCRKTLLILITENKNTQPPLGPDWRDKLQNWVTRK